MNHSRLLRSSPLAILAAIILIVGGCGGESETRSLEDHVHAAMAELPYQYKMLPDRGTEDYVVLFVSDAKRNIGRYLAVGLHLGGSTCPTPYPELPAAYGIDGATFNSSEKGSFCVAEVDHRVSPKGRKLVKMMMGYKVELAIWKRIYGAPECWADRSCSTKK